MSTQSSDLGEFLNDVLGWSGGHHDKTDFDIDGKVRFSLREIPEIVGSKNLETGKEELIVKSKSSTAQRILRTHFVEKILPLLEEISQIHVVNKPAASNSISQLFVLMLKLYKANPNDPFSGYIIALFDGLSFRDTWMKVEKSTYGLITRQITTLNNRDIKGYGEIDKEILKLEQLGLNTTPY